MSVPASSSASKPRTSRSHRTPVQIDGLPSLLTSQQVSAYLGVDECTLYTLRTHGQGPRYIKFGRKIRYRAADVEAWLESHTLHKS